MYLKFLTHGPSPVPAGNAAIRQELERKDLSQLTSQLQQLDPVGANITNLKNRRYVVRAIEICLLSGKKMSDIKNDWATTSLQIESQLHGYLLQWNPDILRQRIHHRTSLMLKNGAIEEVKKLSQASPTCEKAIGISAIRQHLRKEITKERCHELIYFATCQYAKRQRTWFKKEQWLKPIEMHECNTIPEILSQLDIP